MDPRELTFQVANKTLNILGSDCSFVSQHKVGNPLHERLKQFKAVGLSLLRARNPFAVNGAGTVGEDGATGLRN
jgi:hypothetical protein